jgi:ribosomal protein S3
MGQKLNPTIFRLGVNKTWKTEFFEKKNRELPLYILKDLEIKDYIERILDIHGILLHDYKQHYNNSTLNFYISYFVSPDFVFERNKVNKKILVKSVLGAKNFGKRAVTKSQSSQLISTFQKPLTPSAQHSHRLYKLRQYLKANPQDQVYSKASFMEIQNNKYLERLFSKSNVEVHGVLEQVFTVLNLLLGSQLNLVINFCCINKNTQFVKSTQKKIFISFQKFKNTPFFKEGIELLFNVVYNNNSASLLAKFIAFHLRKVKRHKFFLSFLKQTLSVLITTSLSKVKGIKIIVKGRLNGVPRAKHKILTMGDVPVQTISANLDFSQTTTHNSNGSYGIKVWVVEK